MAGPIIVEGPDGQEYEFPEGTSPDVMKQAMRKRYAVQGTPAPAPSPVQQPQTRNTIRTGPREFPTSSDRMSNREDTRIIVQAQRALAAQQEAERLARVKPVEQAAGQAGRAAMNEQWGDPMPFRESEFMLSPQEQRGMQAERQVYRDADVTSSLDAATLGLLNSTAGGLPGILNKDFRGELAQASEDRPGYYTGGTLAGIVPGSIGAWNAVAAPVNALARGVQVNIPFINRTVTTPSLIPTGADALSRLGRYTPRVGGQVVGTAGQNAYVQGAVFEPVRAEAAGEDLTLAGMGEAAQLGATDLLNFLPVGLSAVNRTWNAVTSGIATPSARAAEMANRFGVGPRQTAASQGIAQTTQQLGGQLQGADIRGLTNIENALRFALRDNRNIPDVNARIATGFERIRQSLPLEDDPTLNLARLIEREFAPDAPQTRDIIRNFLRGVGLNSPGGGQIVGDAANQMRGQQADVLRTELESSFGAQPKIEANAAMQQSLDQFSAAYNTVLGAAPRQGPQVDRALVLLAREPQAAAILDDIAQSQNLTVEEFIERNPLQALHEVQSELATQARALAARGDAGAGPLEITVRNMQRPLRDAVPGYGDLQGLWRQWTQARERMGYVRGAAAGTGGELSTVPGFGDKIFGPGGIAKSEMGTQTAADLYLQMDDLSQRAAGLSVRDVINDELRKGKAAGLEERYQTAANMRRVATEGGLDALRRVFGEAGDRVARRIEQFMDANEFARNIDPEFNSATMNKAQAMQTGAQPFAGPMGQATQSAAGSLGQNAVGDAFMMASGITSAPVLSALRFAPWLANRLQPGARTQRNIAETLLRRGQIGSQVPPRPGGPAPITPIDPAMVPSAGPAPGGPPPGSLPPTGGAPPQAPRTVGVAPAAASVPAGAPVPTTPIRTTGIGIGPNAQATLQQSAFGSIGGSAYGSQNDVNGDGVIDEQDAYAGAFLGGVGVPMAAGGLRTVGKGKLGTRTADAAAVAAVATGGSTAEADTGGATKANTGTDAQARIAELSQSQANAQQQITEYEQGLKDFKALPVTEKQRFLKENGFLGSDGKPLVIDGRPEGNTAFAIKAYEAQAGEAIAAAKAERETFRKDINDIRVALAQKPEKQTNPLIDKLTEYGTYGAVAYLAHRGRGAMVKGSQVTANRAAAKANALLTRLPVPPEAPRKTLVSRVPILGDKQKARIKRETTAANKAEFATEERLAGRNIPPISSDPTSPDGLPVRLANVDEFDRQAAAGDFGPVGRIGRFMEPVNSRFRGSDLAVIGTGAADTYITEGMIQKTREDIVAEEKKLAKALADDDPDAIGLSTTRLEQLRQAETVQVILQRIGIGMMIGGGFGLTHGRYARPQPRYEAAARERDLINRAMAPAPAAPPSAPPAPLPTPVVNTPAPAPASAKPRTVGKPKPKPLNAEELRKLAAMLQAAKNNKD